MTGALTAVDMENLAGREGRVLQIQHGVGDVADIAHASHRCSAARAGWCYSGCIGVLMTPGQTALLRIPRAVYSIASLRGGLESTLGQRASTGRLAG